MRRTRQFWFVVFPDVEALDLAGPWSVLGYANEVLGRRAYDLHLASSLDGDVRTRHGLALGGARPLDDLKSRGIDAIVIPGGPPTAPLPPSQARVVSWLRQHHRAIGRVISICTGAFVLGEAGLLDGRRATTHWNYVDDLRRRFPKARVVDENIFLHDRRVWTSAGITAGIDLMLTVVEEDHGHAVAMSVAKHLVLILRRTGPEAQCSAALRRQEPEPARLRDVSAFILEHLDRPLPVATLARAVGMSGRTLTRWCDRELGRSPAALVRDVRLEEAQRLLAQTPLPLKDIPARTRIGDASTLWRVFTRHLGITPAAYRARYGAVDAARSS